MEKPFGDRSFFPHIFTSYSGFDARSGYVDYHPGPWWRVVHPELGELCLSRNEGRYEWVWIRLEDRTDQSPPASHLRTYEQAVNVAKSVLDDRWEECSFPVSDQIQ